MVLARRMNPFWAAKFKISLTNLKKSIFRGSSRTRGTSDRMQTLICPTKFGPLPAPLKKSALRWVWFNYIYTCYRASRKMAAKTFSQLISNPPLLTSRAGLKAVRARRARLQYFSSRNLQAVPMLGDLSAPKFLLREKWRKWGGRMPAPPRFTRLIVLWMINSNVVGLSR